MPFQSWIWGVDHFKPQSCSTPFQNYERTSPSILIAFDLSALVWQVSSKCGRSSDFLWWSKPFATETIPFWTLVLTRPVNIQIGSWYPKFLRVTIQYRKPCWTRYQKPESMNTQVVLRSRASGLITTPCCRVNASQALLLRASQIWLVCLTQWEHIRSCENFGFATATICAISVSDVVL
jgi:hypothetical protein